MPVPYMRNALKGWTKKIEAKIILKTIVDHLPVKESIDVVIKLNKQPVPSQRIERKPEGQRSWKWWSFIVEYIEGGHELNIDDKVIIDDITYNIQSKAPWNESGFIKYEATEDFR